MTNEEKAIMIADQCKPCTDDFYSGIKQGVLLTLHAEQENLNKAKKYDEIDAAVGEFYETDDEGNPIDEDGGLDVIGEIVALKLGYL